MVANRRVVVISAQIQSLDSCRTKNAQCEGSVNTCGLELRRAENIYGDTEDTTSDQGTRDQGLTTTLTTYGFTDYGRRDT